MDGAWLFGTTHARQQGNMPAGWGKRHRTGTHIHISCRHPMALKGALGTLQQQLGHQVVEPCNHDGKLEAGAHQAALIKLSSRASGAGTLPASLSLPRLLRTCMPSPVLSAHCVHSAHCLCQGPAGRLPARWHPTCCWRSPPCGAGWSRWADPSQRNHRNLLPAAAAAELHLHRLTMERTAGGHVPPRCRATCRSR